MKYGTHLSLALLAATLLACTPAEAPAEHARDAVSICGSYGFAAGTPEFESCATKLDPLASAEEANRIRCEAIRQQAPTMTPTGGFTGGYGSSTVQSDAAYRICLTERTPPPVQIQVPPGRTATCQLVQTHIECY
jgi:hypothetical protein